MQPIYRFMPNALAGVLRNAPLTDEKVAFAWRTAVGPAVDNATVVSWQQGRLLVQARDDAWRREVERSAGIIRARLDALLGSGVVRTIDVTM